jgi:hypothetical protein
MYIWELQYLYTNASCFVDASKEKPTLLFDEQFESKLFTCDFNKDQ